MINRTIQALILVLGLVLISPTSMASERTSVSATTTFRISVYIAPSEDLNPRLSQTSLLEDSEKNCANPLEDAGLSAANLNRGGEILARNFFCSNSNRQYEVAEQKNAIVLTAIPV